MLYLVHQLQAKRFFSHPLTDTEWLSKPAVPILPCLGESVLPRVLQLPPKKTQHGAPLSSGGCSTFLYLVVLPAETPTTSQSSQERPPSDDVQTKFRSFNPTHSKDSSVSKDLWCNINVVFSKGHPCQLGSGFKKTKLNNWRSRPNKAEKEKEWQVKGRGGA